MYFASLWLVEPCLGGCVRCSEHAFICVSVLRVGMASWRRAWGGWSLGMASMHRPGLWMARWLAADSVCMRGRMRSACSCMVVHKHSLGRSITVSPFLSFYPAWPNKWLKQVGLDEQRHFVPELASPFYLPSITLLSHSHTGKTHSAGPKAHSTKPERSTTLRI